MKIAAISDIHGNLFALDAVLADVAGRGVDLVVNLGDILSGPLLPRESADRLMGLGLPTIGGNHERQVATLQRERMGPSDGYAFDTITAEQRDWIASLPKTLSPADDVFMCHATPDNDVDCYLENLVDGRLVPAAAGEIEERTLPRTESLVFCGHSHLPRVAHLASGQIIVNPGSVGIQAYHGHDPSPHMVEVGSPHARYAIAERRDHAWTVQLLAIPYEWEASARLAMARGQHEWARALRTGFVTAGA